MPEPSTSSAETAPRPAVGGDQRPVSVVGIGADGWDGLVPAARRVIEAAELVVGGERQLELLPPSVTAERRVWPSPLRPALPAVVAEAAERRVVVLASGDPMFFGIGGTLVREFGAAAVRVLAHPSSVSLACARLGWPVEDVEVVSVVGRPVASVRPAVQPGRRVLVLLDSGRTAGGIADWLTSAGYGGSALTLLADLGGVHELRRSATARDWAPVESSLAVLAIDAELDALATPLPRTPGLPDEAFDHDGQLTKYEVRAVTLAALAAARGPMLWDVGAGSGSVGIEWMRADRAHRAVAVEPRTDRLDRIAANADRLGVAGLQVVAGRAPQVLAGLPRPDAIFVGGAVSLPGVIEACVQALGPGGRLVANGVTVETEAVLAGWYARLGGSLTRIAVQRASAVGGFTGWRPAMPVTQWAVTIGGQTGEQSA